MKSNIHVKRSMEETESNGEELKEYLSSLLGNDERGTIDTARRCRNVMRKARNKSATTAMGIPIDDHFGLSAATYIYKNLLRVQRYS